MAEGTQRGGLWPWLGGLGGLAGAAEAPELPDLAEALEALFAEEARALRAASFERLEALAVEKARLAEALAAAAPLPQPVALRLQALAQRNAALLEASGNGLRAAAERIGRLSAPPPPLQTYDDAGRRMSLPAPGGAPGRRA